MAKVARLGTNKTFILATQTPGLAAAWDSGHFQPPERLRILRGTVGKGKHFETGQVVPGRVNLTNLVHFSINQYVQWIFNDSGTKMCPSSAPTSSLELCQDHPLLQGNMPWGTSFEPRRYTAKMTCTGHHRLLRLREVTKSGKQMLLLVIRPNYKVDHSSPKLLFAGHDSGKRLEQRGFKTDPRGQVAIFKTRRWKMLQLVASPSSWKHTA